MDTGVATPAGKTECNHIAVPWKWSTSRRGYKNAPKMPKNMRKGIRDTAKSVVLERWSESREYSNILRNEKGTTIHVRRNGMDSAPLYFAVTTRTSFMSLKIVKLRRMLKYIDINGSKRGMSYSRTLYFNFDTKPANQCSKVAGAASFVTV
mmetsp:Transcript_16459/g.27193  ORF Transcript_16459/g.27193 Transcript_16459/m.27193 type:complete len:151 (+) Transcript_16459:2013-2465(+)